MKILVQKITKSESSYTQLILRLTFGIVLWPHGAQLLVGWFGGPGYTSSMTMFEAFGLSPIIAFLVIIIQFFGSLLILAGLFTRLASIASIILFLGMIFKAHLQVGFFMNWAGTLKGEGYEYHILAIGVLLVLAVYGSGKFALDNLFKDNK
ncbi:MAG: DoxX family protein [Bacteroidetes bacterium]|nr:DoxX family protein [Bacteroidota bacterium]